jgi:hypothetical protein
MIRREASPLRMTVLFLLIACAAAPSESGDCARVTNVLRVLSANDVGNRSEASILDQFESALEARMPVDESVTFSEEGAAYKWTSTRDTAEVSIIFISTSSGPRRIGRMAVWCSKRTSAEAVAQVHDWLKVIGAETTLNLSAEAASHFSFQAETSREIRFIETNVYERNNRWGAVLTVSDFRERP